MKKIYQIKETCPMWNDGTGISYERILPFIFKNKEVAERCNYDLEEIACERFTCTEYEIIELKLIENIESYEGEDKYKIHGVHNLELIGRG